ncbi:MAG TPA: gliding motility-associated C-terminal domain-containing protein [Flavobacteriales bacterium]|nr:gliding motility-associated C-terminal domain-containing protein [Flavobacteriales bacterium]
MVNAVALFVALSAAAQGIYDHWNFGRFCALGMGTNPPSILPGSAMNTREGVVTVSNASGDLLCYSDGVQVWDRTNAQMPNGFGLFGHHSSTQSALVVPDPADAQRYYLFTTPAEAGDNGQPWSGLAYSVINMNLNNGLGDVELKNITLVPDVTEKLTATRHANGHDVWVVAHGWNSSDYYAYPITCAGVGDPVISSAGRVMNNGLPFIHTGPTGCIQFNPAGSALAAAWTSWGLSSTVGKLDLVLFNKATGQFTSGFSDTHSDADFGASAYGVCFSANGERLYLTENSTTSGPGAHHRIWQYDLDVPQPEAGEQAVLDAPSGPFLGTLQRARDGSIYVAQDSSSFIGRIAHPNLLGPASSAQINAVAVGGTCMLGLPNHWNNVLNSPAGAIALRDTTVCQGDSITLFPNWAIAPQGASYLWNTGDTTDSLTVHAAGMYWLQVQLPCTLLTDTVTVTFRSLPVTWGPAMPLCSGDSLVLRVDPNGLALFWDNGDTSSLHVVRTGGMHWVIATDAGGCITGDTVFVEERDCLCPVHVPNAFTPNADGINDTWGGVWECSFSSFELDLFDRWGRVLQHTNNPSFQWDGRVNGELLPDGLYAYRLRYAWEDGAALRHRSLQGHVLLMH